MGGTFFYTVAIISNTHPGLRPPLPQAVGELTNLTADQAGSWAFAGTRHPGL